MLGGAGAHCLILLPYEVTGLEIRLGVSLSALLCGSCVSCLAGRRRKGEEGRVGLSSDARESASDASSFTDAVRCPD